MIKVIPINASCIPKKATADAVGFDVYPNIAGPVYLEPYRQRMVPLGFRLDFTESNGIFAMLVPRSGLGSKHGIVLGNSNGIIDPDFQGEVTACVWNRGAQTFPFLIEPGKAIAQMLFLPYVSPDLKVTAPDYEPKATARGEGGFGSTG
jgi:dUTP pyrophosphatase